MSRSASIRTRRGFSLIEVLLAIFILGIGIISIGAIFPAGIVQQRQSLDDALGPVVADNALASLRAKLSRASRSDSSTSRASKGPTATSIPRRRARLETGAGVVRRWPSPRSRRSRPTIRRLAAAIRPSRPVR